MLVVKMRGGSKQVWLTWRDTRSGVPVESLSLSLCSFTTSIITRNPMLWNYFLILHGACIYVTSACYLRHGCGHQTCMVPGSMEMRSTSCIAFWHRKWPNNPRPLLPQHAKESDSNYTSNWLKYPIFAYWW